MSRGCARYKTMSYMPPMKVVATRGYDRRARLAAHRCRTGGWRTGNRARADGVAGGSGNERRAQSQSGARQPRQERWSTRIVYYVVSRRGVLYLIDIYAKSAKEDLTDAESSKSVASSQSFEAQALARSAVG